MFFFITETVFCSFFPLLSAFLTSKLCFYNFVNFYNLSASLLSSSTPPFSILILNYLNNNILSVLFNASSTLSFRLIILSIIFVNKYLCI